MKDLEEAVPGEGTRVVQEVAAALWRHRGDRELPGTRELADEVAHGEALVRAALRELEDAGAVRTRDHAPAGVHPKALWRRTGAGTLLAAMPLPYSRRYEGLATGLRDSFEASDVPFALAFMRGANVRVAALLEGRVDLVVLSRFAADRMANGHPVEIVADLGPTTYTGGHGLVVRKDADPDAPGLRLALDSSSVDMQLLAKRVFADRPDIVLVEASYMQLGDLFARGAVDATLWNLDEVSGQFGPDVRVQPFSTEIAGELSLRNSRAALLARTAGHGARAPLVRSAFDPEAVAAVQAEVVSGTRPPTY